MYTMIEQKFNSIDESFFDYGVETSDFSDILTLTEVQSWFDWSDYSESEIFAYWIHKPFAFAVIHPTNPVESDSNTQVYELYQANGTRTTELVRRNLDSSSLKTFEESTSLSEYRTAIEESQDSTISDTILAKLCYTLLKKNSSFDELYPIATDANVQDVFINQSDPPIVKTYSSGSTVYTPEYGQEELTQLMEQLKEKLVKQNRISYTGMLNNRYVHITESGKDSNYSLHIGENKNQLSIPRLIQLNMINETIGAYLWILVETEESIQIGGSPQSGRTTLMRALLDFIPEKSRTILIGERLSTHTGEPYTQQFERTSSNSEDMELFELGSSMLTSYFVVDGDLTPQQITKLYDVLSRGRTVWHQTKADSLHEAVNKVEKHTSRSNIGNIGAYVQLRRLVFQGRSIRRLINISELEYATEDDNVSASEICQRDPSRDDWLFFANDSDVLYEAEQKLVIDIKDELEDRKKILSTAVSNQIFESTDFRKYVKMYNKGASVTEVIQEMQK